MSLFVPDRIFLTKGVGRHKEKLSSFEMALRDAGIQAVNFVQVSSIFPPNCRLITKETGLKLIHPGQITFMVMSRNDTNEPHRLISASIGMALPADPSTYGYLSEHHGLGLTDEECGDYAEDLAAQMLATTLGIPFDEDSSWDERQEAWKLSDKIVKTTNITQSAIGQRGVWTTVISAAVLLLSTEENGGIKEPEKVVIAKEPEKAGSDKEPEKGK